MKLMITLIMVVPFITGCSFFSAQVQENTVYQYGELKAVLEEDVEETDEAVQDALEEMELVKISHKKDAYYSVTKAKNAKNEEVVINLEKATDDSCNMSIKVGLTGDQVYSKALYDKIIENL